MLDILLGFILAFLASMGPGDQALESTCSTLSSSADSASQIPCPPPADSTEDDDESRSGLIKVGGSGLIKVGGSG